MRVLTGIALAVAAAGCLMSIDDSLVDRAGASLAPDASTDASPPADGGCPPAMAKVAAPDGGAPFCVDATEVTRAAYLDFLSVAEPPPPGSQIAACSFNTSYVPSGWSAVRDTRPVGGLDWCDARAFCAHAGKRLCGALAGQTFTFDNAAAGDLGTSEWFNACSLGGARAYPYGDTFDGQACDGTEYDAGDDPKPIAVGEASGCQGGVPGLFDMSGNVAEFLDECSDEPDPACDGGASECALCLLVGGSFGDSHPNLACRYVNEVWRGAKYVDNGFRCCADTVP
jgi:formylglycine-generating enzyme required for sulfatase activity